MRTRLLRLAVWSAGLAVWSAGLAFCLWFWWSLIGILSSWFCCGVFA